MPFFTHLVPANEDGLDLGEEEDDHPKYEQNGPHGHPDPDSGRKVWVLSLIRGELRESMPKVESLRRRHHQARRRGSPLASAGVWQRGAVEGRSFHHASALQRQHRARLGSLHGPKMGRGGGGSGEVRIDVRLGREWGSDGCTHPFVGIFRRLEHLVAQSAVHLATDRVARISPLSWPASKSRESNFGFGNRQ